MSLVTESIASEPPFVEQSEAVSLLPVDDGRVSPVTVIATEKIRGGFDRICLEQAANARRAPGVTKVVLNPDAHAGYGAPIGCVMVSPTHIYPGPVGVDVKCSMSLLQLDLPGSEIAEKSVRRALIDAITDRIPTGAGRGQRSVKYGRTLNVATGTKAVTQGASADVCGALGIPFDWALRCEDSVHRGHDGTLEALEARLDDVLRAGVVKNFADKVSQLGSYGGGNHFGECSVVRVSDTSRAAHAAQVFGLKDSRVAFLSHCGSRGFGNVLATNQFKVLREKFTKWGIPFPAGDRELVYAPLGTPEADDYLDDLALGSNFATVNHLLINTLVLEAFQTVFPGVKGQLVYFISHNIARKEVVDGVESWVHRKGATRAFPGGHFALKGTPFEETGHPILLPGNPRDGSVVMVADPGAERSCYSVNHGAGRAMGRKAAGRTLDQKAVDDDLLKHDILSNCRTYPIDEAPDAYKDFHEVLRSVEAAGLASKVAWLNARFVIKDGDTTPNGD